ncbi:MAG TPA: putative toxin-antitoxin system toxin component, PIN family [Desulfatiglandales bacterium]|nr:putative toxin-antitoxin system toxin component, PIN family [Desulfatiglandales bacterium]
MKKVVIDTNVLVSALLFGGYPGKLITLWKERRIQPLSYREIMEEYLRVLAYPKFRLAEEEIEYLLSHEVLPWFEVIEVQTGQPYVVDDPSDNKFIWCAVQGNAKAIISSDQHLLSLSSCPIPIFSPLKFLGV